MGHLHSQFADVRLHLRTQVGYVRLHLRTEIGYIGLHLCAQVGYVRLHFGAQGGDVGLDLGAQLGVFSPQASNVRLHLNAQVRDVVAHPDDQPDQQGGDGQMAGPVLHAPNSRIVVLLEQSPRLAFSC